MQTPKRVTLLEFNERLSDWLAANALRVPGGYECRRCGSGLKQVTASISIHFLAFEECGGAGDAKRMPIPYCPKCEAPPEPYGCVHVSDPAEQVLTRFETGDRAS